MTTLTPNEFLAYTAIVQHQREHGYCPSIRYIAQQMGRSYDTAHRIVCCLAGYKLLRLYPSAPRKEAMQLVDGVEVGCAP